MDPLLKHDSRPRARSGPRPLPRSLSSSSISSFGALPVNLQEDEYKPFGPREMPETQSASSLSSCGLGISLPRASSPLTGLRTLPHDQSTLGTLEYAGLGIKLHRPKSRPAGPRAMSMSSSITDLSDTPSTSSRTESQFSDAPIPESRNTSYSTWSIRIEPQESEPHSFGSSSLSTSAMRPTSTRLESKEMLAVPHITVQEATPRLISLSPKPTISSQHLVPTLERIASRQEVSATGNQALVSPESMRLVRKPVPRRRYDTSRIKRKSLPSPRYNVPSIRRKPLPDSYYESTGTFRPSVRRSSWDSMGGSDFSYFSGDSASITSGVTIHSNYTVMSIPRKPVPSTHQRSTSTSNATIIHNPVAVLDKPASRKPNILRRILEKLRRKPGRNGSHGAHLSGFAEY